MPEIFRVHDTHLQRPVIDADLSVYPRAEGWADGLMCHDMAGFAVLTDGSLVLMDECGNCRECPPGRFLVEWLEPIRPALQDGEPDTRNSPALRTCDSCFWFLAGRTAGLCVLPESRRDTVMRSDSCALWKEIK